MDPMVTMVRAPKWEVSASGVAASRRPAVAHGVTHGATPQGKEGWRKASFRVPLHHQQTELARTGIGKDEAEEEVEKDGDAKAAAEGRLVPREGLKLALQQH